MKQTLQFRILSLQVIKRSLVILCMALFANSMSIHAQTINLPLIRDAFRNDAFDPGLAVPTPIMETNYVSEDFSAVTNYVGTSIPPTYNENLAQAALKFRLPRSGSVLSRAKLFFRVMDIQGSPTATVTLTDDNGWEQNSIPGLSTFPTLSNASVLLTNAPVSSRGWFSLYLPTSALGAKIVPTGATDATLIITGSTVPNTYFNFVADDDASGDKAYLRITFKPQVQSVSVPANNTYKIGDVLHFTVSFDSLINVTGTPKLPITLNTGGTVQASYVAGSGSQNLVFRYTVASGDLDMDGVTVGSAIELNGGTISSDFGEDAELNLYYVGATTGVLVNGILPTISSVSPTSGPIAGGTSVTITGTGFTGATAVKFGSTNATSFAVNSSTQITAVSPAGSAGATDITITTPNGTSTTNINDKFTYVAAPTVITNAATSITSAGATLNGSINAKNASTTVTFEYGLTTSYGTIVTADQSPVTGGTATPVSKTITGLTAGTTYHYRVNGVNVGGTTNGTDLTFTTVATAPTESFYDQITLPFAPTDDVDMSSSTLAPSMYLASASTVKSYPSKGYKVTLPKSGTITLSASSNEIATNEFAFLVSTSYDASSSSKKYMAAGNGTTTTLTPGAYYIVLFTDNKYGKFRVNITFKALPNITSISPANGPIAGGTSVVITGINFTGTTAVKFGTTAATSYTVNSDTQIIATAPTGTGTVDVRVTTADGTSATSSADRFTYVAAPTITAISPTSGSTAGSTSVVITGTNLTAATAVKFGSANATNFTVNSATQITATAPARSPGVVDITVTTAGGTSATSTSDQFTYVSAPTVTTNAATSISSTGATLNGSVNANNASTAVTFEYGLTTSYGTSVAAAQSPVTGTSATAVSSAITGLTPNTTYHYRVVGVNAEGTTNGADQSFTVQSTPQTISFGALDTKTYGDSPYDLTATSTSGLAVSYSSDNTTVATISGIAVTIVGTGTANITASQVGNATNLAATNVIQQLTVNKKALSVTATADTKTYNGTTVSTAIPTVGTLATGDAINVAPTQVFDNASVGTTHVLTASGLTIKNGGTDVTGNYDISYTTVTGTINKLAVTVTATADTKTYDGTTVSTAIPTVGTLATGDAINGAPTQVFDNAAVGTTHVLTASGLTIKNGSADVTGNYDISYATANGTINKLGVTVTAVADTKTYDGTTVSTAVPTVGTLSTGDAINVVPTQAFDNAAVGTTHVLTASGLTIKNGGTDVTGNYDISYTTVTGTINKLAVTVTAAADTKTYDGTTVSTAVPTVGALAAGDAINTAPTQVYDNASVGTTHVLTASGLTIKNGGTDVTGNYDISYATANGTINKLGVTVTAVADTKTYDGTTVSPAIPTVGTLATGDAINGAPMQVFDNAAVGTTHVLTASGLTIKNGSADVTGNYDISYTTATGTINKLAVTVTATADTKTYDGTTVSTAVPTVGTLSTGDAINVVPTQAFDNATVGTTHVLTASGLTIKNGSTDVTGNYEISYVTATGTINKLAVTVTAAADTKTYDGTTVSTALPTVGALAAGDAINIAPTQAFDNATVGTTHVLTASGLTIKNGGTDVTGNYEISYTTVTGTINKLAVTVTATADTKTYDGTTVSTAVPTVGTLATGDAINVAPTQAFDNAAVGTAQVLTASGLTIKNGGTDVTGNYDISYTTVTGTINKLAVTVTATADTKTYDGTTVSTTVPTVGALAIGDAINLAPTQTFNNATVGTTTHVLTASGLTIKKGSADVTGNYDISYVSANGNITPKSLTITAPTITLSKVYDGNNVATSTVGTLSGVVASDAGKVTVTAVASYDNATVGTNKRITVAYTLGGSAAGNYSAPANFVATGAEISSGAITLEPLSNPIINPANTDLVLSYNVVNGGPTQYKITFEAAALTVGFQNVSYTALATTGTDGSITISVPKGTRPGKYKGTLQMRNEHGIESTVYAFVMTVNIPTEYIAVKYNRVLVLDNSTRMFSTYQWYKDGVAIEGATKQFYRDPKGLVGTYSIQATTTDGEILYSYPKVLNIPLTQKVTAYPSLVRANQTCTVEITDEAMELDLKGAELSVYSSQGIRVYYSTKVEKINTIKLPIMDGMYSGRVTTADGQSFLFKVIVAN